MVALFSSSFFGRTFSLSCHLCVRRIIVVQLLFPVSAGTEASSSLTVVSLAAPTSLPTAPSLPVAEFAWPSLPCFTQSISCHFAHCCSHRDHPHRARTCPSHAANASKQGRKCRSASPSSSSSSSCSKRL